MAPEFGIRVMANATQKPPKEVNTVAGNVLPRTHCREISLTLKFLAEGCIPRQCRPRACRPAAPFPPAPIQPMRSHDNGVRESKKPTNALCLVSMKRFISFMGHLHWSGVTDGLPELTSDLVLRRQIDLLEKLRGDGQAARRLDLPQRIIWIMAAVKVVAWFGIWLAF